MAIKGKDVLIGGVILVAGYELYKYYQNAQETANSLVITPADVSVDTTHILNPLVYLTLNCGNPTDMPIDITHVYGVVTIDGTQVGTINNSNPQRIFPNTTSSIKLNVSLNLIDTIIQLVEHQISDLDVRFKGYMSVNQTNQDFDLDFSPKKKSSILNTNVVKQKKSPIFLKGFFLDKPKLQANFKFSLLKRFNNTNLVGKSPNIISGKLIGRDGSGVNYDIATLDSILSTNPSTYIGSFIDVYARVSIIGHQGIGQVTEISGELDGMPFYTNFG